MARDIAEKLAIKYYDKFQSALDEYLFLAMTEDCHPLIERCEQAIAAQNDMAWHEYLNGDDEAGDILHESHNLAQMTINIMLKRYVESY